MATLRQSRKGAALVAVLVAAGAAWLLPTGVAGAASPSDGRATFHDGNVVSCDQVGFPGDTLLGSGGGGQANGTVTEDANFSVTVSAYTGPNSSGDSQQIDVTAKNANFVIDAVIVKGSSAYNQYDGAVSGMISPLTNGGNVPVISHWFLCYHEGAAPPEETPPTTVAPGVAAQAVTTSPTFTG